MKIPRSTDWSARVRTWGAALLLMALAAGACNLPNQGPTESAEGSTPTPFILYVTATPEAAAPIPPIGGFQPTFPPPQEAEPTLDLSIVTAYPTPLPPTATQPGPTATPTLTPSPSPTPIIIEVPTNTPLPPPPVAPAEVRYANILGVNFINSPQHPENGAARVQAGLRTGAGWNRFAIYWNEIETSENTFQWGRYDEAVQRDVSANLRTNAILLGTPRFRGDNRGVPNSLFEPVFADGSDAPGSRKTINPANPWAVFVYEAVSRYRPGGTLARQNGWGSSQGVRIWEVWNEPDFTMFWLGNVEEYARLLEVAFLAAKHADSNARVMVGGLVLWEKPGFLDQMLNIYKDDDSPVPGRYPFDIVALHAYSDPAFTFWAVQRTESLLAIYGISDRDIWLNESGVTVWDDYPGPEWASRPDQIVWRATEEEQAAYIIQNASYAFASGTDVLFHFQLYDDCGNQPAGTTFPPHDGGLCSSGLCWGDALGLYRNDQQNTCFNQHPNPGSPRPALKAFNTVAGLFAAADFVPLQMFSDRGQRWIIFARPDSQEMLIAMWNETGSGSEAVINARASQADLVSWDGIRTTISPGEDGFYRIFLPPATNRNSGSHSNYMIGGTPSILIQQTNDPFVSVLPLLNPNRAAFLVKWAGNRTDLRNYEVYYRDLNSGGDWALWLEADQPGEALFVGGSGRQYAFFARAQAPDGRWSTESPVPQAVTTVE